MRLPVRTLLRRIWQRLVLSLPRFYFVTVAVIKSKRNPTQSCSNSDRRVDFIIFHHNFVINKEEHVPFPFRLDGTWDLGKFSDTLFPRHNRARVHNLRISICRAAFFAAANHVAFLVMLLSLFSSVFRLASAATAKRRSCSFLPSFLTAETRHFMVLRVLPSVRLSRLALSRPLRAFLSLCAASASTGGGGGGGGGERWYNTTTRTP